MGIFSSTTKTKTTPWAPQAAQLENAFGEAQQLLNRGTYQGDYYAGMNPMTSQGYNALANFGQNGGTGQQIAQQFLQQGNNLAGASNDAMNMVQGMNPYGGAQNQGVDPNNLNRYIDNGILSSQIDAASQDVVRNLREGVLNENAANAAGSGNLGSSRLGVMDAIATRGAGDRIADISSQLRSDAYNRALGMEANRMSQNASLQQQAGLQADQTQLRSANMFNQMGQQGMQNLGTANDLMINNMNNQIQAGNAFQQDENANIQAQQQQFNAPWDLLNRYYGIVGSNQWGGTTEKPNPMTGQLLGAGIGAAGQVGGAYMMSDERLKSDIRPIDGALDKISRIRGVTWNWNDGSGPDAGVIAQDIEKVLEDATTEYRNGDILMVDYAAVNGLAIEAIKELRQQIGEAA